MDKYHRATNTDIGPYIPGIFMLDGVSPPEQHKIQPFERMLEREYLAIMQSYGVRHNQADLGIKTRITWKRRPKICFKKRGSYYWMPTYSPSTIEIRALVPKRIYARIISDKKREDSFFEQLERIIDISLKQA